MKLSLQKGSRTRVLAVLLLLVMVIFIVRLFYLQIVKHDYYVEVANNEQVSRLTIPAKRGEIYALANGQPVPLVMNQTVYTVFADPATVTDADKIVKTIQDVAGDKAKDNLKELVTTENSRYQVLATKVSRDQANKIKEANLNGVGFQEASQRVYIEGSLASQTLGFVNYEGKGLYGVEGYLNDRLSGTDGILQSVMDVNSVPLTIGDDNIDIPAQDGENIVLSVDRNIQSYTEQALSAGLKRTGATRGSVVVINPQNGRVMAMTNQPTYNPSDLSAVADVGLFNNAVVSAPYEPGSDVKTLTMATGIDKGVVKATDTYVNTDIIKVDDREITNASLGHTGTITFQYALNWSLNTGFVTVAKRLGDGESINRTARDTMYHYFHDLFRLGQLTGIEVANEAVGTVISPDEEEGNAVRYSNMAFGQGLDVTMIQVASAFCSLVNGGKYYKPTVLAGQIDGEGNYKENDIVEPSATISTTSAAQIRAMVHEARNIFYSRVDKSGYYIGGKTGTSQVIKNGTYSDDETVGTYLGFGGSEETSNYVIMVQVSGDHKKLEGARDAMPIFTDISNWLLDYLEIKPKG